MNTLRLTGVQLRYVNKAFWRNPASAFFTFVFPLMFLVIFTSLLGHFTITIGSKTVNTSTYYVASMGAFAAISACFNNIAMAITFQREELVLKRVHGTPLPAAAYLGARVLHAVLIAVVLVAITAVFGHFAYQATLPTGLPLLRFIIMLLVGSAAFCALGLALSGAIPNADATAPIVNAVILPVEFLSGIFIAFSNTTPSWILWIARIFPVRHFAVGMQSAFLGTPFSWTDVLIVAAWGVGGMLIAVRYFHWDPRPSLGGLFEAGALAVGRPRSLWPRRALPPHDRPAAAPRPHRGRPMAFTWRITRLSASNHCWSGHDHEAFFV